MKYEIKSTTGDRYYVKLDDAYIKEDLYDEKYYWQGVDGILAMDVYVALFRTKWGARRVARRFAGRQARTEKLKAQEYVVERGEL